MPKRKQRPFKLKPYRKKRLKSIWSDYLSGQFHAPGYNFLGPGTKDMKRKPVNKLDALARTHDLDYGKIQKSGHSPYLHFNWADRKFLKGIQKLKKEGFQDTEYADFAYRIFDTKRRIAPHSHQKEIHDVESKPELTSSMPKRYRGKKKGKKNTRYKRRRKVFRRSKSARPYRKKYNKVSMVKRLNKAGYHTEKYRIDRGNVSKSALNQCTWFTLGARSEAEIKSRLNNLEVFDTATGARKTVTTLDDDKNFNAYIYGATKLTLINNQGADETKSATEYFPETNIMCQVYLCFPRYGKVEQANPTSDLQAAFVSNGMTNDLTTVDKIMSNAPYFKRYWRYIPMGSYSLNPGEKRVLSFRFTGQWWRRYKSDLLGDDYSKNFSAFWLIRQQGDLGMNPITDADEAKPFWCASRLTAMSQELVWMMYNQNVGGIRTSALTTSSTVDSAITQMPETATAVEVDEEQNRYNYMDVVE